MSKAKYTVFTCQSCEVANPIKEGAHKGTCLVCGAEHIAVVEKVHGEPVVKFLPTAKSVIQAQAAAADSAATFADDVPQVDRSSLAVNIPDQE